ncbi:MAG: 16S rRNA (guanine(527)-N(7))-methyltransferase RsmG [Bacteroidota bacterium]
MEEIKKYFPHLTNLQIEQFSALKPLYKDWNNKINVISRKDIDNFYIHHVLHSLAVAHFFKFKPNSEILDVGTGGGFPGIPLAIMFPECDFLLVDSVGKKIKVVNDVASKIGLKNVKAANERAENIRGEFDFIVSRAVTNLPDFYKWVQKKIKKTHKHDFPNGILYLKGGDLENELILFKNKFKLYNISEVFHEDFFETKKLVYVFK